MPGLVYCDYIADRVKTALNIDSEIEGSLLQEVGNIEWDLHPKDGYLLSTDKWLYATDINGNKYRISVEKIEEEYERIADRAIWKIRAAI